MIEGVIVKDLKVIPDDKGEVRHMLRRDDPLFKNFGEIYFSFVNPGQVKAWKKHTLQTQCFAVPVGSLHLVIYDDRPASLTRGAVEEFLIGEDQYQLIMIPPGLWYGFTTTGHFKTMIANCTDIPHDPLECVRKDSKDPAIPYQWK
ncbi:MAG: dTDP-4-dehydrorhamnose 3,5-epimerase family protein [Candidatus Omnitrophica bacterium]|nr:dTDP-4-dehydrorhamnose 3,5-epimerase family protein [Candidatus Omnitrophota bacterium]